MLPILNEIIEAFAKNWKGALLLGIILFSVKTSINTVSEDNLIRIADMTNTTQALAEASGWFMVWSHSLTSITPAWRFNWFKDKYIVGINDIPFPDGSDVLGLAIPIYFMLFVFKRKRMHQNWFADKFYKLLIFILLIVIAFMIWKHLIYRLYLYSSGKIHLTILEAIAIREGVLQGLEKVTFPLFLISIFSGVAYWKMIKRK